MAGRTKTTQNLARVLAVTLACMFVLFLTQIAIHSHEKGQSETTCQVCQAAHPGSAPSAGTLAAYTPLSAIGYVQALVITFHSEFFFHDSPSRAPPFFSL
jgi:hypothetical protein